MIWERNYTCSGINKGYTYNHICVRKEMIYKYIKLCHPKSLDTVLDTLFDTVFLRGYIKIYEILTILIFKKQASKKAADP